MSRFQLKKIREVRGWSLLVFVYNVLGKKESTDGLPFLCRIMSSFILTSLGLSRAVLVGAKKAIENGYERVHVLMNVIEVV